MTTSPSRPVPFGPTMGFTVNGMDRLSARRDDRVFLEGLFTAPDTVTLVLIGDRVLLDEAGSHPWFPVATADRLGHPVHAALLGRRADGGALLARTLPGDAVAEDHPGLADLRGIATQGTLAPADIGALAQAKALFNWHRSHGFCANCGQPSVSDQAGWRRSCPACGTQHFPRTDPVVIMMATDGARCLLGRQPRFPAGMYSCLAGFMEPGETIEDAVRRELAEESGIVAGAVRYGGSQPWPFPASLMIGCLAEAATTTITVDPTELEDARWFSRNETRAMLEGRHPDGLACPPTMAIANHLMRAWAYGD